MRMDFDAPKPEIKVVHGKNINYQKVVDEVLHGIEEEGVPFSIEELEETNPVELAFRGAELSHLGDLGIRLRKMKWCSTISN